MCTHTNRPHLVTLVLLLSGSVLAGSAYGQPQPGLDNACVALSKITLPQTRITRAEAVYPKGEYVLTATGGAGGPQAVARIRRSFCRVAGVVEPKIRFEVWMPLENWNGRFQGLGNGSFLGALPYPAMAQALERGYAAGGTDTGHESAADDGTWAMSGNEFNVGIVGDWAHRGIHEMTVKSQAIVERLYGRRAHHSYFAGCSSGGYQALTEAQRYPNDYDGILAGAPANYLTHLQAAQLSFGLAVNVDPATNLEKPFDKLPLLHKAVMNACDATDGVKDGLIENPAACRFDPAVLACKGSDGPDCLTPPQVQAVKRLYADVRTSGGTKVFPGFPHGSDLEWRLMTANYLGQTGQVAFAESFYRYFVFHKRDWSYRTMDLGRDVAYADQHVGKLLNSVDANLRPFRERGGKLIQYHGWADWGITPYSSVDYFKSVVAAVGGSASDATREVQRFHRLFLLPGVSHCRGGVGPDVFDGPGALAAWVERGEAPERIEASKVVSGKTTRTRPLCAYPNVAQYDGSGSIDDAANFRCVAPK